MTTTSPGALVAERHSVSTLELFFDLVFVFAITQVTAYIAGEPTAGGLIRGLLLLGLVYWSWVAYSWLGTGVRVDRGRMSVSLLMAMAAMFCVAVLIPQWFVGGAWAVAAVAAYVAVRGMHIALYLLTGKNQPEMRRAATSLGISVAIAAALLLAGAVIGGTAQVVLVLLAVVIDPAGAVVGGGRGWLLDGTHFAERHGLIVIIALGESLVALGVAASGVSPSVQIIVLCLLGALLASLLYFSYFRRTQPVLEHGLEVRSGAAAARYARDAFSFLHSLTVGGIVLVALALKKAAGTVADEGLLGHLHGIAPAALLLGAGSVVLSFVLMRLRTHAPVPPLLWLSLVLAIVAGLSALWLPVLAVMALLALAFLCAALRTGTSGRQPAFSETG